MKSRLASVRAEGGLDRVDRAVQLLEEEWRRHGEVQLENFWAEQHRGGAVGPVDSLGFLAALVKADLRLRYDQGQTPTAAGYLQRFPELRGSDSRVLSLVYEEYCLSEERGSAPDVDSFCDRYPELKSSLASQLRYHRLFSQAAGVNPSLPRFPEARRKLRGIPPVVALGDGGNVARFPGQGPFARRQASRLEGDARPRSGAEGSRGARSSSHRPGQLGHLSDRRPALRVVHAVSAGAAAGRNHQAAQTSRAAAQGDGLLAGAR